MTKTITTAKKLLDSVDPFHHFPLMLKVWEEDRRCSFPLQDLLLEYGLERQARAAKWAADQPDKEPLFPDVDGHEPHGAFPRYFSLEARKEEYWYWKRSSIQSFPHWIPMLVTGRHLNHQEIQAPTAIEAIVLLLDNWGDE